MIIRPNPRSVLQRRTGIGTLLQPLLDGLIIIGVSWYFVEKNIGYLTQDYVIFMLVLLGLVSVMYDRYAIYRSSNNFTNKMLSIFNAWTITFLALILLGFLTKQSAVYSRLFVVETYVWGYLLQCFSHGFIRRLNRQIHEQSDASENVVIVGEGALASYLEEKISSNPWLHQRVIGTIWIDEERKQNNQNTENHNTIEAPTIRLGEVAELATLVDEYDINTIYIITPLESSKVLETLYFDLLDKHVSIHWVPDIFSLRLINHSVREIAGIPVLTLSETPLTGISKLSKAIEDRVLAFLILLVISPLLATIAIAIKLDSPGPIFFRQKRTGWNGKTFRIWKFRSMKVEQDVNDIQNVKQAQKNDPRITRVGKFIRKTSLDELPQLLNVLFGDMSLVGPRPHAVQHDEVYSKRITDYYVRNNIKPGITGLAQVRGYRGETQEIDQMMKRIESDIEYINNWSISLDLSILMRSVTAFTGKGAY